MSADNGIYIGRFPIDTPSRYEWRVIHGQAIENCSDDPRWAELVDAYRVLYFGGAEIFYNRDEAWLHARKLADECDILEYGVSEIEFDRPLVKMTAKEANKKLDDFWKKDKPKHSR